MQVKKAYEISDAKIQFVSLVDKAANKRQFLITKAEDGSAQFTSYGKILKVDDNTHYITGVVYEPMVADAHDNYMTEEEILKAAHWFMKNSGMVDLQHSFEEAGGVALVESYIAPCDMEIDGEPVVKGSWLLTVEVENAEVWSAVQKGDITGFSMGGLGKYSKEDIDLGAVNKTAAPAEEQEQRGLFKKLAAFFGFDMVEKGAMADAYKESMKSSSFWNAFWALEDILYRYNWATDRYEFATDEQTIRDALADFNTIITDLLADQSSILKAVSAAAPVIKAGKKMSSANQQKLDTALQTLTELRENIADEESTIEKEEIQLDKTEMQNAIGEAVAKGIAPLVKALEGLVPTADPAAAQAAPAAADPAPAAGEAAPAGDPVTKEDVAKMIEDGVADGVAKALEPILKRAGLASNLNDQQSVEKSGEHYLAGIL